MQEEGRKGKKPGSMRIRVMQEEAGIQFLSHRFSKLCSADLPGCSCWNEVMNVCTIGISISSFMRGCLI